MTPKPRAKRNRRRRGELGGAGGTARSPGNKTAGYSGKPLAAKLGLKAGQGAVLIGVPAPLLAALQQDFAWSSIHHEPATALRDKFPSPADYIHLFVKERAQLRALPKLRAKLAPTGMIWVSWPKRAAKIATDVSEGAIRAEALSNGLVDVKVCAVDEIWSGLKLVIPVKQRSAGMPGAAIKRARRPGTP